MQCDFDGQRVVLCKAPYHRATDKPPCQIAPFSPMCLAVVALATGAILPDCPTALGQNEKISP